LLARPPCKSRIPSPAWRRRPHIRRWGAGGVRNSKAPDAAAAAAALPRVVLILSDSEEEDEEEQGDLDSEEDEPQPKRQRTEASTIVID